MNVLVIALHIIVCLVFIIVILLQAGRGQGLTGSSFGGNVQSLFGTKASSFLTKATTVCAVLFLFTCIGLNIYEVRKSRSLFRPASSQAPIDVEQLKSALEKIKQSDAAKATESAVAAAKTSTNEVASSVSDKAKDLAGTLTDKAEEIASSVSEAAQEIISDVEGIVSETK